MVTIKDVPRYLKMFFIYYAGGEIIGLIAGFLFLLEFFNSKEFIFLQSSYVCFGFGFIIGVFLILLHKAGKLEEVLSYFQHFVYTLVNFSFLLIFHVAMKFTEIKYIFNSFSEYFVLGSFMFMIFTFLRRELQRDVHEIIKSTRITLLISCILMFFAGFVHLYFEIFENLISPPISLVLVINFTVMLSLLQILGAIVILFAIEIKNK